MIGHTIKERKDMLTKHLSKVEGVEQFIDRLRGEKYTDVFGNEVIFGEGKNDLRRYFGEDAWERKNSKQDGYESVTGRKVKLANFSLEYADLPEGSGVLEKLQENISYLEEAVRIYEETNDDAGKKFNYMMSVDKPNGHLENLGYFEDVCGYVQGKLDQLSDDLGLNYFRLTAKNSQFTGRGMSIYINLDTGGIPSVDMYTVFGIKEAKINYPSYIGVDNVFSSKYINDKRLTIKIKGLEEDYAELTKKYYDKKRELETITENKLKATVHRVKKGKLNKEIGEILNRIEDLTYPVYELKDMMGRYLDRLTVFEEHLPDILEEQNLIMDNLKEMLNKEVVYMEKGFSN